VKYACENLAYFGIPITRNISENHILLLTSILFLISPVMKNVDNGSFERAQNGKFRAVMFDSFDYLLGGCSDLSLMLTLLNTH